MQCSFIVRLMDRLYTPSAPESGRDCFTHARHTHPFRGWISAFLCALLVNLQPWESNRKTDEDQCTQDAVCEHQTVTIFKHMIIYWTDLQTFKDPTDVDRCADPDLNQPIIKVSGHCYSLIGRLYARAAHCVVWEVWTHFCYYALCKTRHISTGSDRGASTSERWSSFFHAMRFFS